MTVLEKEPETVVTKPNGTRKKSAKKNGTASAGAGTGVRKPAAKKKTASRKTTSRKVTAAKAPRKASRTAKTAKITTSADERQAMIAEAAYYLA